MSSFCNGQLKFHPPFFLFLAGWPSWLEVGITGHNFGRGPSKDHSTKVWFKLAQWLQRSWLKCEKLTDGRTTDDGCSVVTIAHLTFELFGSGELKKKLLFIFLKKKSFLLGHMLNYILLWKSSWVSKPTIKCVDNIMILHNLSSIIFVASFKIAFYTFSSLLTI